MENFNKIIYWTSCLLLALPSVTAESTKPDLLFVMEKFTESFLYVGRRVGGEGHEMLGGLIVLALLILLIVYIKNQIEVNGFKRLMRW